MRSFVAVASLVGLLVGCGRTNKNGAAVTETGGISTGGSSAGGSGPVEGGVAGGPESCAGGPALAKARLWRLTDEQYANAVQQLFGVAVEGHVTEARADATEFSNFSEYSLVGTNEAVAYQRSAKDVAARAVAAHFDAFMPCGGDEACAEQLINNRVARAFGRRLEQDEVERYLALYRRGAKRTPQDGVRLVLQAALQSPAFLYRSELGPKTQGGPQGQVALTSPEVATLLAYTFTNSLPDEELWEKGDSGALADPAEVKNQVARLRQLPETQVTLTDLASYWLGVHRLRQAEKDLAMFPEFTPELRDALHQSGQAFVGELVKNGSVRDLVSSNSFYANELLSTVYGVPGGGKELRPVASSLREWSYGVLSQPAILAGLSASFRNNPIHRGLFVLNALLCDGRELRPPPNELEVEKTFPPDSTEREYAQLRAARPDCASCHLSFESLGLLSERYDAIGHYREADASGPIDDSAFLAGLGSTLDGETHGLKDLSSKLLEGRALSDCTAQNLTQMLLGRNDVASDDSCTLAAVKDELAASGKLSEFFAALAASPGFVRRDAE